jgi:SAM-dependent methyltransferase
MTEAIDQTTLFSGRVEDYVKARPSYPTEVIPILRDACALGPKAVVADLGSGTGLFTRRLLEAGASVHAVEPNDEMRAAAEATLRTAPAFHSVAGSAEATTLPDACVDIVTAAQAFHWFDVEKTRAEMTRILRHAAPPGSAERAANVALVWNDRHLDATPLLREYEELLVRTCPKYRALQGKADAVDKFDALLGAGQWKRYTVPNEQRLDRDGLVNRLLSSSYAPKPGEAHHDATVADLRAIFDRHASGGEIALVYTTVLIIGRLPA